MWGSMVIERPPLRDRLSEVPIRKHRNNYSCYSLRDFYGPGTVLASIFQLVSPSYRLYEVGTIVNFMFRWGN